MISAKVIADSKNEQGNRITTMVVTFPRFILAELNTHRMISRNSASSRAIPTKKMLKMVMENPFIPIAWQKDHSGMQGTEYFSDDEKFSVQELKTIMFLRLQKMYETDKDQERDEIVIDKKILELWNNIFEEYAGTFTLNEFWEIIKVRVVQAVLLLHCLGVTKQLCNRLLEPFMWHTVLITATEWENFFSLRCPQYTTPVGGKNEDGSDWVYRSKKDVIASHSNESNLLTLENFTDLEWLKLNKGQAEIHMMELAEVIWDAYNESTPKELKAGEWHIPFSDNINLPPTIPIDDGYNLEEGVAIRKVKIATAMCARVSYTVVGEEGKDANYDNDIKLHDRLATSGHWSPFEHCAKAMNHDEYRAHISANPISNKIPYFNDNSTLGWSGNFKGFIQYRKTFKGENKN